MNSHTGQTQLSRARGLSSRAPHYVYRCYDADGGLLYVGCAMNVKRRIAQHAKGRARASLVLSTLMARYEVEGPFATRYAAQDVERAAIQAEMPLLNIQHGLPGWLADRRLEDYLTELGLPLSVGGLHRCTNCDVLRGYHMEPGLCSDCREFPELPALANSA